jgi:Zn-dependent peptidase ImmA (M78 family)
MPLSWYGSRYPKWRDLERHAEALGAVVVENGAPKAAFIADPALGGPMILIPAGLSPLDRIWNLAHETGHLVQHTGPLPRSKAKQEAQADRWAACALIPQARIRAHQNASEDAFIGALSAHYEEIPMEDCPARRLAAKIARVRLQALQDDPVSGQIPAYSK